MTVLRLYVHVGVVDRVAVGSNWTASRMSDGCDDRDDVLVVSYDVNVLRFV
jgi:hypothetical protein